MLDPVQPGGREEHGRAAPDVVVIGSANVDYVATVGRRPAVGETVAGEDLRILPGGKGANQAVAAARSGARVAFVGAVGSDPGGDLLLGALRADGVDTGAVRRVPGPSGSAVIVVAGGDNSIVIIPGANAQVDLAQVDAHASLVRGAKVCVVQGEITPAVTSHACRVAHEGGVRVMVNLAPPLTLEPAALAAADPLVVNTHEAASLLGRPVEAVERDPSGAASALAGLGSLSVVVTLGADGAVVHTDGQTCAIAAEPVRALDSTGAGDGFVGALAACLARGSDLVDGARFAARFAAIAVTRHGAQSSYPDRTEVETFDLRPAAHEEKKGSIT